MGISNPPIIYGESNNSANHFWKVLKGRVLSWQCTISKLVGLSSFFIPRPVFVEKAIGPKNHKNTKTVELQLEEST